MRFAEPTWLLVGAATVTILVVLLARAEHLRGRALALLGASRFAAASASVPSRLRRSLRVAVMVFAVAMGFVALARPQKGLRWETVERNGTDVLLVVDTSHSMDADDVKPTRIERTKLAIQDFVDKFPGNRVGLVAFAGDAFVQSPMTLDHEALLETVAALDTSIVARGGTNIGKAIEVATDALSTEPNNQKAMVLVTDGEDLEGQGLTEAKKAGAAGIIVDTIGVGSPTGELVPQKDERGRTIGVIRDESGKPVRSHLDESALRAISDAAHGTYHPLGADGRGLDHLYEESLNARVHHEASSQTHRVYAEWFRIPLGLALGAIVLDAMLGLRWRRSSPKRTSRAAVAATAGAVATLLLLVPGVAMASVADAQKAYADGKFDEAHKQLEAESAKNPKDAKLAFNAGDAAYKAGHFDAAEAAFKRALTAADPSLQQHVLYNQGDSLYRLGEKEPADARDKKREAWTSAVAAYEGALALNPKDADAKYNRDLVKRKLKELEEEKPKDPPKQDDKGSQDQKQQGGQQPKDQQQGGQQPKDQQQGGQQPKDQQQGGPQPKDQQQGGPQPNGKPKNGNQPNGKEANGQQPNGKLPGARLDPKDARALLGAVKGDERHAVRRGVDAGAPVDDGPSKDW
ncbi:MAG: hypothetical protein JWO86_6608 [Myxococcaceae bacterium]|nr:hypothetical protein [Myxococcaceae bacterium]